MQIWIGGLVGLVAGLFTGYHLAWQRRLDRYEALVGRLSRENARLRRNAPPAYRTVIQLNRDGLRMPPAKKSNT